MTPEDIRKQLMTMVFKSEDASSAYEKATTFYKRKDYREALTLAQLAADQGHAGACELAGRCYAHGFGVEKDLPRAQALFEQAAKAGFPRGMRNYAVTKLQDSFGPPDYAAAVELLHKSMDAGDLRAPAILASLYLHGTGVEKDTNKYLDLIRKGIDLGDEFALMQYAECLAEGEYIERDLQQALELAKSAQQKGLEQAQFLIADLEAKLKGEVTPPEAWKVAGAINGNSEKDAETSVWTDKPSAKSILLMLLLGILAGPAGLLFVSWKAAAIMGGIFALGLYLLPDLGAAVIGLWVFAAIAAIAALLFFGRTTTSSG
jgi:TPR repeat protein